MSVSNDLKREVDRLTFDLQQAHQEKIQAAEYGLAVLEEKQELQDKYDESEALVEVTKAELAQVKEQLELLKSKTDALSHQVDHKQGTIVQESTTRESAFATKISELQVELKKAKKVERNSTREVEHFKQQYGILQKNFEEQKDIKDQLVHENKELKVKDARFNEEYNMLEEENTVLQKSISKLKHTLVEYEGLKVENKSLLDEVDSLQLQLQMTTDARNQYEKQLHEALDTVREQRERNTHLQKDIHELKQKSIMKSWQMEQVENIKYGSVSSVSSEDEHPIVKQITEEYKTKMEPTPGLVEDLMKELQFGEIRDLEEQLRVAKEEKNSLAEELQKKNMTAESVVAEASRLLRRGSSDLSEEEGDEYTINNQLKELSELKEDVSKSRNREIVYQLDVKRLTDELDEMKEMLVEVETERNLLSEENEKLKENQFSDELLQLKSKVRECETSIKNYKEDIRMLKEVAGESQGSLNCTQDELYNVLREVHELQQNIYKIIGVESKPLGTIPSDEKKSPERGNAKMCNKLTSEIKQVITSMLMSLDQLKKVKSNTPSDGAVSNNDEAEKAKETLHLKEQLLKLQSLLSTKREQITTLRTVLKANKATYEVALANVKSRYENDKAVQTEQNGLLKRQMKALKHECQTFSSLRGMYTQRCEDYMKDLDAKNQELKAAEEEKLTLNKLLKQAIHQKITLTQRLEEFELARERLRQFTKKNIKSSSSSGHRSSNGKNSTPAKPVTRV